ncbi:MAG: DNA adenine methylase, partial [Planctomycetes bacterium]|nr:DNA adenine methylase [Planctomycetota bacterium]
GRFVAGEDEGAIEKDILAQKVSRLHDRQGNVRIGRQPGQRHQRLRNVCILRRCAFALLEKIEDAPGVAIYVDPPYIKATRGSGGGSRYLHDFYDDDHARLAELLNRFKQARVVVSYYSDPRLHELYAGWTFRPMHMHKNLHVQNRRGSSRTLAPEVLLMNGPSYAEAGGLFA